jgi:hypothetical protein
MRVAAKLRVGDCVRLAGLKSCAMPVGSSDFREAEVEDLHLAFRRDLDVGWFEVAVDHALLVRRFEGVGDLDRYRQRFFDLERRG